MLRKCLSQNDETDGIELNVNCPINSSCCGGGSAVNKIDEPSDDENESKSEKFEQTCEKLEVKYEAGECSQAIKEDILQPESSSEPRFDPCFSRGNETAKEKSEGMALEATHVYTSSKRSQTLSNS